MLINSLRLFAEQIGNQHAVKYACLYEEISQKEKAEIVVVGEFSNGKTTLLNALIGKDILPTGIGATTSKITYLKKGNTNKIICSEREKEFNDSDAKKVIGNFINQCNDNQLTVYFKDFIFNDFLIADTPGINDIDRDRELITYEYAPKADAMIFVLDVSRGFTKFEKEFFDGLSDTAKDKIFVVFNKIDTIDNFSKGDLEKLLESGNIKNIKGFGISAKMGVKGAVQNLEELTVKSGIEEFKTALIEYVNSTESRQAVKHRKEKLLERSYSLCKTELESHLTGFKMNAVQIDNELIRLTSELNRAVIERDRKSEEFEQKYNQIRTELESLITEFRNRFMSSYTSRNSLSQKIEYIKSSVNQENIRQLITNSQSVLENTFEVVFNNYIPDQLIIFEYSQKIAESLSDILLFIGDITSFVNKITFGGDYLKKGIEFILKGSAFLTKLIDTAITESMLDKKVSLIFDNISNDIASQFTRVRNSARMQLDSEVEKIESSISGFEKTKSEMKNESENLYKKIESVKNLMDMLNKAYESELMKINR